MDDTKNGKEVIVIDLSGPLAAKSVKHVEHMIQRPAWHAIEKLIALHLREAKKNRGDEKDSADGQDDDEEGYRERRHRASGWNDINLDRRHDTITITGGRGSGKTTFILSLVDLLRKNREHNFDKIVWLRLIDPTLLENKENILVTILSEIYRRIDMHYRNKEAYRDDWEQKYKDWHRSLRKLAEGITVLDSVGSSGSLDAWEDPQHVLEQGLSRAKSGMNLERCLHQFIEKSLDFLGKDAFGLIFDDIDTRFDRGWIVLEVIRKYLTSPKLIVIVLGDMHLYSMLVRQEQWAMLNKMPGDEMKRFAVHEDIDHLQSQYLHKLLKVQNRVQMRTLDALIADDRYCLTVKPRRVYDKDEKSQVRIELSEMIQHFCEHALFLKNEADVDAVRHLILHQPIRNVLHLFSTESVNQLLRSPETTNLRGASNADIAGENREEYLKGVHDVFAHWCMDALYAYRVYTDELLETTEDNILNLVINFLNTSELWQDGYRLKPEFREDQRSLAMLALGSRVGLLIRKSPKLLAQYFISIGLTREAAKMKVTRTYQEFVGLTTIRSLDNTACRAVGYFRSTGEGMADRSGPKQGSIAVKMNEDIAMREFERSLAGLPALRLVDVTGESKGYLSVYPLIAVIGDLLGNGKIEPASIDKNLRSWGQIYSFSLYCGPEKLGKIPQQQHSGEGKSRSFDFIYTHSDSNQNEVLQLSEYVASWVKWANEEWIKNNDPLPAHVLGDMWSRFRHALEHVDEIAQAKEVKGQGGTTEEAGEKVGAGTYLHWYIVAFLNSVLVEEHLARNMSDYIILFNQVNYSEVFSKNLERRRKNLECYEKNSGKKYCWFDLFFSFPLWALYLRPDEQDKSIWNTQIEAWRPVRSEPKTNDLIERRKKALCINVTFLKPNSKLNSKPYKNLYQLYNSRALEIRKPEDTNSNKK